MTKQEIFDRVVRHLGEQRVLAYEDGSCKYRDSLGNKCAVGCLIPDSVYQPAFEGHAVRSLYCFPEIEKLFSDMSSLLLADLQDCHDCDGEEMPGRNSPPLPQWERQLYRIAEMHGLDDRVIGEYSWDS